MTDDLYDGPCVAGCKHFHGGEIRHHKDCGHYPESLIRCFEDRIAALEAELAAARRCPLCGGRTQEIAVKVKPLVWEVSGDDSDLHIAGSILGLYFIRFDPRANDSTGWMLFLTGQWTCFATLEAAKAAAQADCERRILSAIEAAPVKSAQDRPSVAEAAKALLANCPNPIFDDLKPEMIGEIRVPITSVDDDGDEVSESIMLPWYSMKEVIHLALRSLAGQDGQS